MPKLGTIMMNDNQIEEISLSGLDRLSLVDVSNNPIIDISALAELDSLEMLVASAGDLNSIRKFAQFEELILTGVTLDENQKQECSNLKIGISLEESKCFLAGGRPAPKPNKTGRQARPRRRLNA
jgi:Leucine-rich repeat (LRR) protein